MFLTLLLITLLLASAVSTVVARAFSNPIDRILKRIIADEISSAWLKYLKFAILVVGISAGVRIHELEKYINPTRGRRTPGSSSLRMSDGFSSCTAPS